MKNVLVAFNEPKLLKAITKNVRKSSSEDIIFTVKPTKSGFLDEVATGNYSSAILMEGVGREPWTISEMVQVADSYNTTLIPIISEQHKGSKDIMLLSSVGITSAVFIRKGGIYKADEILRMIEHPRTLKEARIYYGIETYADHKAGDVSFASENKINEAKEILSGYRESDELGQILLQVLVEHRFDMAQAAQLLEHLDADMTMRLQKTVEYYDLLEDLYKHNLVSKYHIPREVKKLRKQQKGNSSVSEEVVVESVMVEKPAEKIAEESMTFSETTLSFTEEDCNEAAWGDEEEEIPEEEEYMVAPDEEEYKFSQEIPFVEDDEEEEFSFAGGLATVPVTEDMAVFVEREDVAKKHAGELKRQRKREVEEELEEMEEEGIIEKEPKKINPALICVIAGCAVLLIVLTILFVKVSIDRARAVKPQSTETAYNTPYSAEDVAKYELGEKGELILKDEEGNVLYDSANQAQVTVPEEEMDISIVTEEVEDASVTQQYNDISGFENGKSYKGLELVNLINGTQGANCSLQKTNGAVVEVTRGNASLEDFLPSAMYQCQVTDGTLIFVEQ